MINNLNKNRKPLVNFAKMFFVAVCAIGGGVLLIITIFQIPNVISKTKLWAVIVNVKSGNTTQIIDPDPNFLQDIARDTDFVDKVDTVSIHSPQIVSNGGFYYLRRFHRIKCIHLWGVGNVDVFLENIQGLESLEVMTLHKAWFSETGAQYLESFPHLELLMIDSPNDATLKQLTHLTQLKTLMLNDPQVDEDALSSLRTVLKGCEIFSGNFVD